MSGMVECYLINQDGRQCNFSPAVTNTRVIFGKNQPFLGVEITVAKYMFDSDDFWNGQTPAGTALLTRPELIQNSTPIHIKTYGGEYDLVYTQTLNPDDMTYVLLCYTKMWQSKTTEVSSLISDIVWSGQSGTYDSGTLAITCNGITTNTQIGGVFLPTDGAGVSKNNVQLVKPSRVNVTPPASLASIGTLRVLVPIYQDPTIPTDALVGYTEPTGEVSFDDLEHTMRADTVYASILFEYAGPFSKQDLNNYYKGIFANLIIPQIAYVLHPLNKVQQNINGEMVVRSGMQEDGILYCKGVEYVTGYGQTLFAWLSNAIGGYVGTDLVIDKGYKMESSAEILSKLGFDTETLAAYKANDNPPTERTYGDSIYKLVPDTICYDLIKAVSIATNRTAFIADVPYLSSFEVAESEYDNALSELTIQYTPNDNSYCAYFIPLGETEPQQIALGSGVEYNDQGSTYLVGEQTARSANASVTVKATDAGTDIAGMPVEVNIDTASIDSSKEILAQVAFNTLVENYHPSNTLSFIALENTSIPIETTYVAYMTLATGLPDPSPSNNGKYYINAGVADVNLYLSNGTTWTATAPTTGDSVTVYAPSNIYYFVFNGTVWNEYRAYAGVERHALFRPDTRCATLEDTRSHTTLTNVPLAYTILSWPDCTTRYMFGEPIFQDTEETIADLQAISKQSVTNTSVSEALSKPYVTTVIGNMSLDEAGDDLTDFSGLILQRNESTGVASMDGYMGGQRQARFSSDGAISSGVVTYNSPRSSDPTTLSEAGDSVVMDRDGFHTRSWHLYPQTSPQFAYADGYWVEETRIGVDGEISAGAGSVVLGHDGLTNYDSDGEPAYTLDDDGLKYKGQPIINSENGKIQLKVDGAAIDGNLRAISITLPYVQIDNEGLRTFDRYFWDTEKEEYQYFTGDLQCSVGTNGVITAGAGAVKLDQYGLSTWTGAVASDILGGWDYTNAVRQCAVTTDGKLIAGSPTLGWSLIDGSGFRLYYPGVDPTTPGASRTPMVWIDSNGYHMKTGGTDAEKADIQYGSWASHIDPSATALRTDVNLLSNVKLNVGPVCAIAPATQGDDPTVYYSVVLSDEGLKTYSYITDTPSAAGYVTTATPVEQCSVGTNGAIIAGSNLVTLNERGITVGSASSTAPTILSLNNQSLFTISDTSNLPSVCISDNNSSFKNNVTFKNDISVADEIYIGDNMGKFAPRSLTVSVTARSGSTVISGTDTYNSIVISPQSQDTLVGPTTLHARIPSYIGVPTITTEHLDAYTPSSASQATDRIMGTSSGNIQLQWTTSKRDQPHYTLDWGAGITLNNNNANYGFKTEPTSSWTESYLAITLDSNYPTTGTLYTVSYENSKYVYKAKANALYTKSGTTYTVVPENTELNTYTTYYAKQYDLTVASVLKIDIPISWTATSSDGGVLNEVIQVELEYQTREYTARYTSYEGITNTVPGSYDSKTVTATLITSTSAGSDTLHFELKNPISLVNEVLSGTVVLSLLHMDIKATLPLSHTISIGAFSVSSLANITGNELIVSNGGIWGSTVIPAPDGSGGLNFLNYGSAPIANTTYVSSYVNAYSTSSSTMGLKRVIVLPSGDSLPTYGRDGDICIFVAR